jgi:hypothetical protein
MANQPKIRHPLFRGEFYRPAKGYTSSDLQEEGHLFLRSNDNLKIHSPDSQPSFWGLNSVSLFSALGCSK